MSSIVFTTWTTPLVCVDDPMTTTIHKFYCLKYHHYIQWTIINPNSLSHIKSVQIREFAWICEAPYCLIATTITLLTEHYLTTKHSNITITMSFRFVRVWIKRCDDNQFGCIDQYIAALYCIMIQRYIVRYS